jgi:hypothetical protein
MGLLDHVRRRSFFLGSFVQLSLLGLLADRLFLLGQKLLLFGCHVRKQAVCRSRFACLDISVECVEYGISVVDIYWPNIGQRLDLGSACRLLVGVDVEVVG